MTFLPLCPGGHLKNLITATVLKSCLRDQIHWLGTAFAPLNAPLNFLAPLADEEVRTQTPCLITVLHV